MGDLYKLRNWSYYQILDTNEENKDAKASKKVNR